MRTWNRYTSEKFIGLISTPEKKSEKNSLLVLLHGVGANEQGLTEVGNYLSPESIIVSLRAPLVLGPQMFGWFHVQFTPNGPVHNWPEAHESFLLLEQELKQLSLKYDVPFERISLLGFSQGSIMTMGLALMSDLTLGNYVCLSGRTLP